MALRTKRLTLILFGYVAVLFSVKIDRSQVVLGIIWLPIPNRKPATLIVAICRTTISPYLLSWQASQEVDEIADHHGSYGDRSVRTCWSSD